MTRQNMWAIKHTGFNQRPGFYEGTWALRKDAVKAHTEALGVSWTKCYHSGDRAVRVVVSDEESWKEGIS